MTNKKQKKYWFPAKKYGWGWTFPDCWQGWAVFGVYGVVVVPIGSWIAHRSGLEQALLFVFAWTILLILIVASKGERLK